MFSSPDPYKVFKVLFSAHHTSPSIHFLMNYPDIRKVFYLNILSNNGRKKILEIGWKSDPSFHSGSPGEVETISWQKII